MTTATRRFIDLIGEDRLDRGSQFIDRGLVNHPTLMAANNGKVAVISSFLYPREVYLNPYLPGSDLDRYYSSGAAIERRDLADVVGRARI